jgi:mono/diheme cytochrome c family protein
MSLEATQPMPANVESARPLVGRAGLPVWFYVLLLVAVFIGGVYFDQRGGWFDAQVAMPFHSIEELQLWQIPVNTEIPPEGKRIYETVCALCHNVAGTGNPNQAPPFAGSEWATGNPKRMIRIPLVGLTGPIKVKDQTWNLAMPAMGSAMSDSDLAAVLTYIRKSWGNNGSKVTAEEVKAVRADLGARSQPITASELEAVQ